MMLIRWNFYLVVLLCLLMGAIGVPSWTLAQDPHHTKNTYALSELCDQLGGSVIYDWSDWMDSTDFQLPYHINEQGLLILGQWVLQAHTDQAPLTVKVIPLSETPLFLRPQEHPQFSEKNSLLWLEEQAILSEGYLGLSPGEKRHLYLWHKGNHQVLRILLEAPSDPRLGLVTKEQFFQLKQYDKLFYSSQLSLMNATINNNEHSGKTSLFQTLKWPTNIDAIFLLTLDHTTKKLQLHELPRDGRPFIFGVPDPNQSSIIWKAHMRWKGEKTSYYIPLQWLPKSDSLGFEWTTSLTQLTVGPSRSEKSPQKDQANNPPSQTATYLLSQKSCYQIKGTFPLPNHQPFRWTTFGQRVSPFQALVRMSGLLTSTSGFILTGDLHLSYQPQNWFWQQAHWGQSLWGRTSFKGQILNNWFQWDPNNAQALQFYLWGAEARWHIERGLIDRDESLWGLSARVQQTGIIDRNNQHIGFGLFFQLQPPEGLKDWLFKPWFSSPPRAQLDLAGHWLLPLGYRVLPMDYIADFQLKLFPNETWIFSVGGSIYQFSLGQDFYFQSFNAFLGLGLWL